MNRLEYTLHHLLNNDSQNDVVICSAVRTPITKAKYGSLKNTHCQQLLSVVLRSACQKARIQPLKIQDIIIGNILQRGAGQKIHRMAQFLAGIPQTTPIMTVNRFGGAGIESIALIASKIKAGIIDVGIGGGVQSMSFYDMNDISLMAKHQNLCQEVFENQNARKCMITMGQIAQNIAHKYKISRQTQDNFALESHQRALNAQIKGYFKEQIVALKAKYIDNDRNKKQTMVTEDECIRKDTTLQKLSLLNPSFKINGTVTAGNSSQMSDGAAAVVLARRSFAKKHNLPVLGRFVDYIVVGVDPQLMGIAPSVAIPSLLSKTNKKIESIDIWEINEAFASQICYCIEKLKIDRNKVNPKGGGISIGHPLGCTGTRQFVSLIHQLNRINKKTGVVSMCIGTGMGAAALIQREQFNQLTQK